jgi:tetratricopeptide (TPR) repeat protein
MQAAQKDLELNPDDTFGYAGLGFQYLHLGRTSEVRDTLERAANRKLENPVLSELRFYLAFLQNDYAGMQREFTSARGQRGAEDVLAHGQALVLAYSGHIQQAEVMWRRAVSLAQRAGDRETAGMYESAAAVCEAHLGNAAAANQHALAALKLSKGRDVEYAAALALELSGDSSSAYALTEDLEKRFPEDTSVQFSYIPTLHALLALDRKEPLQSLEDLQSALPYDLAFPGTAFFAKFGALYSVYVRGQAYLAAQRGVEAAAEFQRILDHRSLVLADPVGVVAHLQLGRALVSSGDSSGAKRSYQKFLALWKDADPGIPILGKAKTEYARLR